MSNTTDCQLAIDRPVSGSWNMALDEALFEAARSGGKPVWRMYQWSEPTLSLGYFQDYTSRWDHEPSRNCTAVRRLTGGGAILHDRELTYSLVVPESHPLAVRRDRLYEVIHATLIDVLGQWGIEASFHARQMSEVVNTPLVSCGEPLLADAVRKMRHRKNRSSVFCDVAAATWSSMVSRSSAAGQRRRGAVLQHGSILLQRSPAAPEVDSLEDISGKTIGQAIGPEELTEAWLPLLADRLDLTWKMAELEPSVLDRAAELEETRYRDSSWIEHRGRQVSAG